MKFRDMQTPEKQYARRQAGAGATAARRTAEAHDQRADQTYRELAGTAADGPLDPARVRSASRDRQAAQRGREEAARLEAEALASPKKRGWRR